MAGLEAADGVRAKANSREPWGGLNSGGKDDGARSMSDVLVSWRVWLSGTCDDEDALNPPVANSKEAEEGFGVAFDVSLWSRKECGVPLAEGKEISGCGRGAVFVSR